MGLLDVVLVLLGSYDSPVAVTVTALYADGWEAQATVTDKIRTKKAFLGAKTLTCQWAQPRRLGIPQYPNR